MVKKRPAGSVFRVPASIDPPLFLKHTTAEVNPKAERLTLTTRPTLFRNSALLGLSFSVFGGMRISLAGGGGAPRQA